LRITFIQTEVWEDLLLLTYIYNHTPTHAHARQKCISVSAGYVVVAIFCCCYALLLW